MSLYYDSNDDFNWLFNDYKIGGNKKTITATPRQLESLIRLSESLAKMRLSPRVEKSDAIEATRLMKVALQQVFVFSFFNSFFK